MSVCWNCPPKKTNRITCYSNLVDVKSCTPQKLLHVHCVYLCLSTFCNSLKLQQLMEPTWLLLTKGESIKDESEGTANFQEGRLGSSWVPCAWLGSLNLVPVCRRSLFCEFKLLYFQFSVWVDSLLFSLLFLMWNLVLPQTHNFNFSSVLLDCILFLRLFHMHSWSHFRLNH